MTNDEGGRMLRQQTVRVLVVDDEPAICKALTSALQRAGYDVLSSQSGDAALALMSREHVDVLLIDLRIPDTRGDVVFEVAAATYPHLRDQTLFMSGDLSDKAIELVVWCKCRLLSKPFELKEMVRIIDELALPRWRELREQSA